ncbi:type II toxin-antitoxin system VapB family antitoxin [Methyloprofundus sp.]|uniref:type II toxin-antitoxin system VapB family antitoxin n=1 Tax=Methyloprofundus sp. TaxID=2020875 RepID=UPI003D0A9221
MHDVVILYASILRRAYENYSDLPENLLIEAMKVTHVKTKTGVIIRALEEWVKKSKISDLKNYQGKIDIDLNLDELRDRH